MYPIKENSLIHFNYALILLGLLIKKVYDHATNGVMMQHEVKCTPNNQCKCIVSMKTGYATMWNAQFSSNDKSKLSYMKSWLIFQRKSSTSTMQNAKCNAW